ncbi:hypothetical protein AAHN97_15210 [Chitinophaga niabensis]|uniref:hypothetical protein n=1 Tax=Chitinophaga niabensis TaxID=536979 RepID=UPI0031BA0F8F
MSAYLGEMNCHNHSDVVPVGKIEIMGDSLLSPGASITTSLVNTCCADFKRVFDAKVGEFFQQYKD